MILKGNQRGHAKELAVHLMKDENEVVEIHEIRGFLSRDVMGALNEAYAISRGTRCQQFLYSLSLNPPQGAEVSNAAFERAIEKAEERLSLQNQPRTIVFHEKEGRRHCHVVWSRIDIQTMKAKQMSYDHRKLVELSRELYLEHGWEMPDGLKKYGERDPTNYTHAEYQQAKRIGKNADDIKAEIQEAWNISDDRKSLEHALSERGYYLAQGDKRGYVVVDKYGEIYSLPKQLPKGINTKQVRERVGEAEHLLHISDILPKLENPAPDLKSQALEKLNRYHSAFTFVMADRCLKPLIADKQARHDIIDELLQSKDLINIGKHNGLDVHATQNMVDLEKSMLKNASDMAKISSHNTDYHAVERAIFRLNNKIAHETNGKAALSPQQKKALHHITDDKQLSLLVGVAGAGKTTIMEGVKEALEAQGYRVLGAAPTGIAAAGLKDIVMTASTLHSLQYRMVLAQEILEQNEGKPLTAKQAEIIKNATLSKNDALIIDEAGMVPARQLAHIIERTKQSGAKLVLVGDPAQLQSIEAGTAFKDILDRNHHVSLTEIRRQKTNWQCEATSHLSKGNVADALQSYDKNKCIIKAKTRRSAKEKLVKDFMKEHKFAPEQNRLVLAYTRKDVAGLNDMIKAEMVKHGHVSENGTETQITVKDGDIEYQEHQKFAVGDRILFRKNDNTIGVMNGSFGTLKSMDNGRFTVALDNGKETTFSTAEYNHFQLGYASTVHKSQGITVDQSFVLATPHFDKNTSYVALSRHKESVKLYTNRKDFKTDTRLHLSLGKKGEKLSTLDFTDKQQKSVEPEQSNEQRPSFFDKLKSYFTREEKQPSPEPQKPASQHPEKWIKTTEPSHNEPRQQPTSTLVQQDFVKLNDEFMQKADTVKTSEPKNEPDQEYKLEM